METVIKIIEIFGLVTGVPYLILQVLQKNQMWWFGIATSTACAFSFAVQGTWASMVLNIYYVSMSIWGLYQWSKDSKALKQTSETADASIHLSKLTAKVVLISIPLFIVLVLALLYILPKFNDPFPVLDAFCTSLSIVAMWWLGKSIPYHWLIWIVSDILLVIMCYKSGQYWLSALYVAYVISAVVGIVHWKKNGVYLD